MSFDYRTGTDGLLRSAEVNSPTTLLHFYRQELGGELPIGLKQRGLMFKRLSEEMAWQGWDYPELVAAIKFMKNRHVKARSFDMVYHHVRQAVAAGYTGENRITDLELLQAEALLVEQDEGWVRRLSLAKGEALRLVLDRWQEERRVTA